MNNPFLYSDPWQKACVDAWSIGERHTNLPEFFARINIPIEDTDLVIGYMDLCDQHYEEYVCLDKLRSDALVEAHVDAFYQHEFPF